MDIYDAISLETCVNKRTTIGAPGSDAMKKIIEIYSRYYRTNVLLLLVKGDLAMKEEIIEKIVKELREADIKMSEYIYAFIKSMKKDRKK